jgi:hypothetical protein
MLPAKAGFKFKSKIPVNHGKNNLKGIILSFIPCNGYKSIKKLGRKMGKIISD